MECSNVGTTGSEQRGAIDGTVLLVLFGGFSSTESRNVRTGVERLPVLTVEIAQLKRLNLLHWNACQCNCDTVGVRTGNIVLLNATDLTKQMTRGFGVETVLREVILAAFEQRELLCGDHKVPILLHEANGAVAVPHDQMSRGQQIEANGIAVTTATVCLQLLLQSLTLPLRLPVPLL